MVIKYDTPYLNSLENKSLLDLKTAIIEWQCLAPEAGSGLSHTDLTEQIASYFLKTAYISCCPDLKYIDLLLRITDSSDPILAEAATETLYGPIIEGLCNDFTGLGADAANLVLLRMLSHIRNKPQGKRLNQLLNESGFYDEESLLKRHARIRRINPISEKRRNRIRKIILLSRVTIGADVLIVSPVAHRLSKVFPAAELIFIGPPHLEELLCDLSAVRFHQFEYKRFGKMSDKICVWPLIHDLVRQEARGLKNGELVVFDPDTRLTQLGLLPLIDEESTFYFDSRREPVDGTNPSLALLANKWLDTILPGTLPCNPALSFKEQALKSAQAFVTKLSPTSTLIIISLGVGGNENKRLADPFEAELLLALLRRPNTIILLDSGRSSDNLKRILALLAEMEQNSIPVSFITENDLSTQTISYGQGVIGFKGSIGAIGALISLAHGFIGYDSSCQHIAAACGTPSVIAFAGAPNRRFQERWRPYSPAGTSQTIMLEDTTGIKSDSLKSLAARIASDLYTLISSKPGARCK